MSFALIAEPQLLRLQTEMQRARGREREREEARGRDQEFEVKYDKFYCEVNGEN